MGMYTQIRGWLNVDSISFGYDNYKTICSILQQTKYDFQNNEMALDRKWVSEDTVVHMGGNGSIYLFIGTELKNYDDSFDEWVKYLLTKFPNAEGRIDYQYETECVEDADESRYLLIRDGKIIEDDYCKTWTHGYGNTFKTK